MKKYVIFGSIMLILIATYIVISIGNKGIEMVSRVNEQGIQVKVNNEYEDIFLKGVNIGTTKPGYFPGELAITKTEYLNWFQLIKDMNANTIRVYTIQNPVFYQALYEFNKNQAEPLYFMQGVWINEEDLANINDVYGENNKIKNHFIADSKVAVDVIHGKAELEVTPGFAHGVFDKDVSKYMIGWVLGLEWDPGLVINTNERNSDKEPLQGEFVTNTSDSSPFEIFLAEIAEEIISYEVETYKEMHPLSFVNWLTTDPLDHPNEPFVNEDKVTVDMENIVANTTFESGFFASYHIYPYYPEFMNYSIQYNSYIDEDGNINPYKGYLEDLKSYHTMPIVVAEFGVPASRGKAHDSISTDFNQGNVTEEMQGEMVVSMVEDIQASGYAGALIFSWQDEWFKRTWNTNLYDLPHRRPFWSNIQTNEQYFGLLAFDPGEETRVSYSDGNFDEWTDQDVVISNDAGKISVKSDARYLYLFVEYDNYHFDDDALYIAIDTIENQGNNFIKDSNISFNKDADFIIKINGTDDSRIMVDQYYDAFEYLHANIYGFIDVPANQNTKNTGLFNPMLLSLSYPLYLPEQGLNIDFKSYETGKLLFGNGNPSSQDYNSLADFYANDNKVELQIPWQLLNFMDPSTKSIMSDIQFNGLTTSEILDVIYLGAGVVKHETDSLVIDFGEYQLESWNLPIYHERLKQSYYIIKEYFKTLD